MKIIGISALIFLAVSFFIIFLLSVYSGKGIKRIILNALIGIGVWMVLNLTSKYTGVRIPVNIYSLVGISAFSVPAIIGFLVLKIIFKV